MSRSCCRAHSEVGEDDLVLRGITGSLDDIESRDAPVIVFPGGDADVAQVYQKLKEVRDAAIEYPFSRSDRIPSEVSSVPESVRSCSSLAAASALALLLVLPAGCGRTQPPGESAMVHREPSIRSTFTFETKRSAVMGLRVTVEPGIDGRVLSRLEALGHVLTRRTTIGGVGGGQGILFDAATGIMMGGSTPHKDGAAVAW
jgi:hypothetical protein